MNDCMTYKCFTCGATSGPFPDAQSALDYGRAHDADHHTAHSLAGAFEIPQEDWGTIMAALLATAADYRHDASIAQLPDLAEFLERQAVKVTDLWEKIHAAPHIFVVQHDDAVEPVVNSVL